MLKGVHVVKTASLVRQHRNNSLQQMRGALIVSQRVKLRLNILDIWRMWHRAW
jgi:hypothetical protein